ncbi:hypothetical protein U1Q18_045298 [Sarracenia purpurea var. burkii]
MSITSATATESTPPTSKKQFHQTFSLGTRKQCLHYEIKPNAEAYNYVDRKLYAFAIFNKGTRLLKVEWNDETPVAQKIALVWTKLPSCRELASSTCLSVTLAIAIFFAKLSRPSLFAHVDDILYLTRVFALSWSANDGDTTKWLNEPHAACPILRHIRCSIFLASFYGCGVDVDATEPTRVVAFERGI